MLTDIKIKASKPTERIYKVYDADGLYIEVPPQGKKRWRFKYQFAGKERRISLGTYPEVSLLNARARRDEARRALVKGIDPSPRRAVTAREADTFQAVAEEWIAARAGIWSIRHKETTEQRLKAYIYPVLGTRKITEITPLDVLNALRVVERRGAVEAARKTLAIVSQVFRYAVASARIESDVCRDLRGALTARKPGRFAAITTPREVGQLLRAIDGYTGAGIVRCALCFLALTFVRPGELRHAEWAEFDLASALWTIPGHKMKMGRDHVVPLSRQALEILDDVRTMNLPGPYVFASVRVRADGRAMSENTLLAALRALGYERGTMTAHGFRAMASSLLNGLGWDPDVIERQLAHAERNKVRAAYHRTEYLAERTRMMQAYADYLEKLRNSPSII